MIRPATLAIVCAVLLASGASRVLAQAPYTSVIPGLKQGGSTNIHVISHLQLEGGGTTDITVEQELSRPYVYTGHWRVPSGVDIISIKDITKPRLIWSWRIENADLHQGSGSLNPIYLKSRGRYFLTDAFQFQQGGPDTNLGAIVWDITGLPDTSKIKEVARIQFSEAPGGFHESYAYKHSNGEALLLVTTMAPYANVYDIDQVVSGGAKGGLVGRIPLPDAETAVKGMEPNLQRALPGYHDFYVGYEPVSHQDRFYGGGAGGYYVFDITNLAEPKLLTSVTGAAGVNWGHTFTPDPTGRYAVTEIEYQHAPLRIFDLKPGLDGQVKTVSRPIGAWTADWHDLPHNTEVRWPYVFVSADADGFQVFNMMDPTNPYTVGYYYTCECPPNPLGSGGAWGVQVRNADGVIVVSDRKTGLWAFRMDGFDGWNGHQWGLPNVSSAQDWDNGPEGAPKAAKVSVR